MIKFRLKTRKEAEQKLQAKSKKQLPRKRAATAAKTKVPQKRSKGKLEI